MGGEVTKTDRYNTLSLNLGLAARFNPLCLFTKQKGAWVYDPIVACFIHQLSYHPGSTTSRSISEVKLGRAIASTVVGDDTETHGGVGLSFLFAVFYTTL